MSHNVLRRYNYNEASKKVTFNGVFLTRRRTMGGGGGGVLKPNIRVEA